ncbi:mediator of RNA polymerase II transcription subunit 26 isoform X1 [Drosophila guanche]|uniref:Mediator of RNA polymerase II transcription subunit 26 n=1 Tax=Drosophila guanche TaxID=7266 RepID=A0A3B0K484_DROGU|nr:mediator of RNA polymerase II transcription subunit 26 isoform X1 [Drosophila guanche]SPP88965.1 blast:Mediator of RNA polymerase II transcription subunit 26 [Drosophila guanche]
MNQNQIQQLTSHLSQALDQNYDVVNMDAVLSVICALEGTTITKEQLEATRLAKYINQLRRRTKDEHLARRAKSLLKMWREMVGIQQTANDSQHHHSQHSSLPTTQTSHFYKYTAATTESNLAESVVHLPISPSVPSHRTISDLHSNMDSSEQSPAALPAQPHSNFANLINNISKFEREESNSSKSMQTHKQPQPQFQTRSLGLPLPFINEQSLNSVSISSDVGNDKRSEASIVIDIVTDSDDNDNESESTIRGKSTIAASTPLTISPAPCIRPKKFKKDKKHKERVRSKSSFLANNELIGQHSRYSAKVKEGQSQTAQATDSEIFSLSNSSMSSILSGDAAILNSQHRFLPNSSELTFTGRFKTVDQSNSSNQDNSALPIGQNTVFRQNESERPILEDSITNDSSTSCSRLSPPTVEERRKLDKVDDSIQMPMPSIGLVHESNSRTDYLESSSKSQVPKKRGRKKGSKGVDAVIAKESSSLSEQIFFGVSSSVKKVKTTKELFSEIQSRKLITAVQSSTSNISNSSISRELTTRAPMPRPTSSCSDTSIPSPQIMETFLGNVTLMGVDKFSIKNEDAANTDSDTITSEPSQDSNKSQEIKECTSLDSNSNSLQILSLAKTSMHTLKSDSYSDVTTQLMHLIHSIKGPVSVYEVEKLYRAQIVPCTCLVIEELSNPLGEEISLGSDNVAGDPKSDSNNDNVSCHKNQEEQLPKIERLSDNDILVDTPAKPVRSIFDLDFDEGEDPLQSIINDIRMPPIKLKETKENSDFNTSLAHLPLNIAPLDVASGNIDAVQNRVNCHNQEGENSEELNVAIPVFTCHEDPDCVAKQRFHVQTNQVNNFHINALHNFYIPNINGNWDSIDLSIVSESTITDFRSTYTVTDGADVVPKYGSLTYDRIRKDLSSMTFTRSFKTRHFKSKVTAFLGVAKCLPTCRLARRRIKKKQVKSPPTPLTVIPSTIEVLDLYPDHMQMKYNCASPLKVDVDIPVSGHEYNTENNVQMQVNLKTKSDPTLSYNLLKLANSKSLFEKGEPSDKGSEYENKKNSRLSSSSSSSCSNSSQSSNFSLKKKQDSINEKLRNQRSQRYRVQTIEPAQEETSRKRQEKNMKAIHFEENPPIKRIKISLNGKMSNLSSSKNSSSSESESETGIENDNEVENDYKNNNDEEYAVVQRPMGGVSNNHIVMTIKKTPSKINSPANSISATSPINASETRNVRNSFFDSNRHNVSKSSTLSAPLYPTDYSKRVLLSKKNRHPNRQRRYRLSRRKSDFKGRTIDLELKHLFTCKPNPDLNTVSDIKLHKKLFFNHELCKKNNAGRKQRILNYSSSSSSSYDDDESGFTSEESGAEAKKKVTTFEKYSLNIETDTSAERTVEDPLENKIKEGPYLSSSSNDVDVSDSQSEGEIENHEVLDEAAENVEVDTLNEVYNNGMLTSFNSICVVKQKMKEPTVMAVSGSVDAPVPQSTASLASLQNENCDDVNNLCYNNNNLDVIKHSINTSSILNDTIYKNVISNTSPRVLANNFSECIEQNIENSELKPHMHSSVEHQTGTRRTTLKDVALSCYADLDCTRIQKFKEWHQVLQLQSYNNEPLIVLPYVVLE